MPKLTFKERLIAGLLALGWKQVQGRSRYVEFTKLSAEGKLMHRFVGDAGALRAGDCASRSYSIGDPTRQTETYVRLLNAGTPKEVELE